MVLLCARIVGVQTCPQVLGSEGTVRAPALGPGPALVFGRELGRCVEGGNGLADTEIAGREDIGIASCSHRYDFGGPRANTGERNKLLAELRWTGGEQVDAAVEHRSGEFTDGLRSSTRHPFVSVAGRKGPELLGRREEVRQAKRRRRQWGAVTLNEPGGDGGGTANAHLLADDYPHGRLEPVPTADDPEIRAAPNKTTQTRIGRQLARRSGPIIVKAEHMPDPGDLVDDRLEGREVSDQFHGIRSGRQINLDHPRVAARIDRTSVHRPVERLDPRGEPRLKVAGNLIDVKERASGDSEAKTAVGREHIARSTLRPQLVRRKPEDLLDHAVHLADRPKPRSRRNHSHRQVRFVEESPREVGASTSRDEVGRGPDMLLEQAPELTGRVADPAGQGRLIETVEKA